MKHIRIFLVAALISALPFPALALAPQSLPQKNFNLYLDPKMVRKIREDLNSRFLAWTKRNPWNGADYRTVRRMLKNKGLRGYRITNRRDPKLPRDFGEGDFIMLMPSSRKNPVLVLYPVNRDPEFDMILPDWHYPVLDSSATVLRFSATARWYLQFYPSPTDLKKLFPLEARNNLALRHRIKSFGINPLILSRDVRIILVEEALSKTNEINKKHLAEWVGKAVRSNPEDPRFSNGFRRIYFMSIEVTESALWGRTLHELFHDCYFTDFVGARGREKFRILVRKKSVRSFIRNYWEADVALDAVFKSRKKQERAINDSELFASLASNYLLHCCYPYFFVSPRERHSYHITSIKDATSSMLPREIKNYFDELNLIDPERRPHLLRRGGDKAEELYQRIFGKSPLEPEISI